MKKGLFFIIMAGALWGTSCLFVHTLAPYGFSSGQMTAMRFIFAFLGMLFYCLLFRRASLRMHRRDLPLFLICGASLFGTASFYFESMQLTTSSTAVVLMYLAPVPIMLVSVLFFGERFSVKKGIAVAAMLIGCALVAGVIGNFKPDTLGVVMGLLSAASYAIYNIFNKLEARRGIDPYCSTLYTFLFSSLIATCLCQPWELPALIGQRPLFLMGIFLVLGLSTGLFPYLLYAISLKSLSVGVASSMSIIEPMTGALLGFIVYRDPLTVPSLVGILLIICAVFLLGSGETKHA